MEEKEKRMAGTYEITHGLRIGDREVVFGIDPNSTEPYFCALYQKQYEIIQIKERYENCMVSDDYVEIVEQFSKYLQEQCCKVREEWANITVPRIPVTEEMCIPHDYGQDLRGKVVAIKPDVFRPEYRTADHQLVLITHGSGVSANRMGTACYARNLYTGETERFERYEVMGEVKAACMPDWARERAEAILCEQAEKTKQRKSIEQEGR